MNDSHRIDDTQPAVPAAQLTFEDSLLRLEKIVAELQQDDLPLEQSIARYEEGIQYVKQCHATLRRAEQRVEMLMSLGADGVAETVPFADAGDQVDLAEKGARRSQRRTAVQSQTPGVPPLPPLPPRPRGKSPDSSP